MMKLQDEAYLLLTTLRRDGREVSTPMWVAWDGAGRAYMQTDGGSAKVKRIRSQAKVWLAPCNARGQTHGDRVTAEARIIESSAEAEEADRRLGMGGPARGSTCFFGSPAAGNASIWRWICWLEWQAA